MPHKEQPRNAKPVGRLGSRLDGPLEAQPVQIKPPAQNPDGPDIPWWANVAWPVREAEVVDADAITIPTAPEKSPDAYRTNPSANELAPGGSYAQPPMSWEEIERSGADPATFPTYRPRSVYRQGSAPPVRVGKIYPSAPPPPTRMGQPAPQSHPLAHAALPSNSIVSDWFQRVAPTVPELDLGSVRRSTNPPSNPDGQPSIRQRAERRPSTPPARRYPEWAIMQHREYVRIYGWQDVDPRCRGCQAYDRVIESPDYCEHPVLNLLCMECKWYVYSLARASGTPGSGTRSEIYRSVQRLLHDHIPHSHAG